MLIRFSSPLSTRIRAAQSPRIHSRTVCVRVVFPPIHSHPTPAPWSPLGRSSGTECPHTRGTLSQLGNGPPSALSFFSPVVFSLVFLLYFFPSFPLVFFRSLSVPMCPLYIYHHYTSHLLNHVPTPQEIHDDDAGGYSSRTLPEPERHKSTRTTRRNAIPTIYDE